VSKLRLGPFLRNRTADVLLSLDIAFQMQGSPLATCSCPCPKCNGREVPLQQWSKHNASAASRAGFQVPSGASSHPLTISITETISSFRSRSPRPYLPLPSER
jgi:hypothetical protein